MRLTRNTTRPSSPSRARLGPTLETLETRTVPTATLQVIHNSPYATAKSVDVYVNDVLTLDNFNFREATGFLTLPSNVPIKIDITAATALDNSAPIFSTNTTFATGKNYIAIAGGNPALTTGPTAFGLSVVDFAQLFATQPTKVDVAIFHGSPDAPPVDVLARNVATLVDDLPYNSATSGYLSLVPDEYTLDVTLSNGVTSVASFQADLTAATGKAMIVLASGFAAPATTSDPELGLLAVFADGTSTLLPPAPLPTFLQVIHNSPYAAAQVVDVYINGALFLDDFKFQTATPFTNVPSGVDLTIDIVPGSAPDNKNPLFTTKVNLLAGKNYVIQAVGDPLLKTGATAFGLAVSANGQRISSDSSKNEVLLFHGSPDAPPVDVKIRGLGTISDNLTFGAFDPDTILAAPGMYIIDITLADGVTQVASFLLDSTSLQGASVVISATGFVAPGSASDPGFGLMVTQADGTTFFLDRTLPLATQNMGFGGVVNGKSLASLNQYTSAPIFGLNAFPGNIVARPAVADVNGDGVEDLILGAGPGGGPQVVVYDGTDGSVLYSWFAFESTFRGGLFIAAGDFDLDGFADIVVSADVGGGPRVRVFSGANPSLVLADFFGIEDPNFRGGARIGVGDINGDGVPDLLVGAGVGGGPRVAGFNGLSLRPNLSPVKLFDDFFVFEQTLRNGVYVAVGDLDGDGKAEGIFGGGPGGGPRIQALNAADLLIGLGNKSESVVNFFAGDVNNRDGVRLTVKDLDGDSLVDLVTSAGLTDGTVRVYYGASLATGSNQADLSFSPFSGSPLSGIFVG